MSIWSFLGLSPTTTRESDTDPLRQIARALEDRDPAEAQRLAAFAFTLGRVAYADRVIDEDETRVMGEVLEAFGGLAPEQAALVVDLVKKGQVLSGGTVSFSATQRFAESASHEERTRLLDCLFAVAAADDSISSVEESKLRQIASELGLGPSEYVEVRRAYNDKRDVVRLMRQTSR